MITVVLPKSVWDMLGALHVIMLGTLHIEMSILSALWDWVDNSGWTVALSNAKVTLRFMLPSSFEKHKIYSNRTKSLLIVN